MQEVDRLLDANPTAGTPEYDRLGPVGRTAGGRNRVSDFSKGNRDLSSDRSGRCQTCWAFRPISCWLRRRRPSAGRRGSKARKGETTLGRHLRKKKAAKDYQAPQMRAGAGK